MSLPTINTKVFMKDIFNQGDFEQFCVNPYGTGEPWGQHNRFIVVSDKIFQPTFYTHSRKKLALLLPKIYDSKTTMEVYIELIISFTRVHATYFTAYDIHMKKIIFELDNVEKLVKKSRELLAIEV
jgi:hypothetical protein